MKRLEKRSKDLDLYLKQRERKFLFRKTAHDFIKFLMTAMFVRLLTQRGKIFRDADIDDLVFIEEGASLAVYMEKSSHRRLGIRSAVGRHLFIRKDLSNYLKLWVQKYRAILALRVYVKNLFVNRSGASLVYSELSERVRRTCVDICGGNLTPMSIRRLRTTYFVVGVREMGDTTLVAYQVAQHANEVWQTPDILYGFT